MKRVFLVLFTLMFFSSTVSATIITDRSTFLGLSGTVTEHSDISSDFSVTPEPGSSVIIINDVTSFTDKFASNDYVIQSGEENFNAVVTFVSEIYAFGMDVYEPTSSAQFNGCNVSTCVESTFEISFLNSGALLDTITFAPANDVLDFIGYTSSVAFDRIEVRETVGTNDNEMFGNFVTLINPTVPMPLPSSFALMVAGFGVFALVRRRKIKA